MTKPQSSQYDDSLLWVLPCTASGYYVCHGLPTLLENLKRPATSRIKNVFILFCFVIELHYHGWMMDRLLFSLVWEKRKKGKEAGVNPGARNPGQCVTTTCFSGNYYRTVFRKLRTLSSKAVIPIVKFYLKFNFIVFMKFFSRGTASLGGQDLHSYSALMIFAIVCSWMFDVPS